MVYQNGEVVSVFLDDGDSSMETYSTEERVIGTWIDGKPLYRKTFVCTSGAELNTANHIINGNDYSMDKVINISGMFILQDGTQTQVQQYVSSTDYLTVYYRYTGYICEKHGQADKSNRPGYISAIYTKTTDQATIQLNNQPLQTIADMSAAYSMPVTSGSALYNEEILTDV